LNPEEMCFKENNENIGLSPQDDHRPDETEATTSETSVNFYHTTRHNNREDKSSSKPQKFSLVQFCFRSH
jgi:hypothetical protein